MLIQISHSFAFCILTSKHIRETKFFLQFYLWIHCLYLDRDFPTRKIVPRNFFDVF